MSRTMAETQAKQMTRALSAVLADNSPSKTTNYLYGRIQSFRADFGVGVIAAGDGRKYRFARRDLINAQFDLEGQHVHFAISGLTPQSIIVLAGSPFAVFAARNP